MQVTKQFNIKINFTENINCDNMTKDEYLNKADEETITHKMIYCDIFDFLNSIKIHYNKYNLKTNLKDGYIEIEK